MIDVNNWEAQILMITGLILVFGRAFGADYWAFIQNVKATGRVPDGYSGLVANIIGVLMFGLLGAAVSLLDGTTSANEAIISFMVGGLVGFVISLRASEIHMEMRAAGLTGTMQQHIEEERLPVVPHPREMPPVGVEQKNSLYQRR